MLRNTQDDFHGFPRELPEDGNLLPGSRFDDT